MTKPALLTTAQVAARHKCDKSAILARARRMAMAPALKASRDYLWSPEQAEALAPRKPGRPRRR